MKRTLSHIQNSKIELLNHNPSKYVKHITHVAKPSSTGCGK